MSITIEEIIKLNKIKRKRKDKQIVYDQLFCDYILQVTHIIFGFVTFK